VSYSRPLARVFSATAILLSILLAAAFTTPWAASGVASLSPATMNVLGISSLTIALGMFVVAGGGYAAPSSVAYFAWAVFFGFPIAFLAQAGLMSIEERQVAVSSICTLGALVIVLPSPRRPPPIDVRPLTSFLHRERSSVTILSVAMAVVCTVGYVMVPATSPVTRWGLVVSSFAIFMIGVSAVSSRKFLGGGAAMALALIIGTLWFQLTFSGLGRINLAAVGLGFATIWLLWFPSRLAKLGIALTLPAALAWAGMNRVRGSGVREVLTEGTGLASQFAPLKTFADILVNKSRISLTPFDWVDQIVASLFFWVPRVLWSGKPEGFGRLLVYDLEPRMTNTSHSMAAGWTGEGFAYFGPVGVMIAMVVLLAWVRWLDAVFWKGASGNRARDVSAFLLTMWCSLQLLSFFWGGLFSYVVRAGGAVLSAGGIFLAVWLWAQSRSSFRPGRTYGTAPPQRTGPTS
jgi:hypothetical protein